MRTIRAGTTGGGTLIAIVTVSAVDEAGSYQRRNETGCAGVFADALDRVKRDVAGTELQPGVRLHELARHPGLAAGGTVAVAAETQFIFLGDGPQNRAARADAGHRRERAGNVIFPTHRAARGVRIMAVGTSDMADGRINQIFADIVGVWFSQGRVGADFVEVGHDIFPRAVAGMAVNTVFFRGGKPH